MSGEEGVPADATVARLVGALSPRARDLALQGVEAARAADAGDPFGYLGGLVNMRALESDGDDGDVALAMDVTPNALNRYGYVHGGMLFTLADYAMGVTARGLAGAGKSAVTLEAKANYLTNAREGTLVARCAALHQTEHLIVLETRLTDAATDALMMVVTGTYYIIPREAGDADGDA
jgi:uncharacterized protein (TIGR00369 family)